MPSLLRRMRKLMVVPSTLTTPPRARRMIIKIELRNMATRGVRQATLSLSLTSASTLMSLFSALKPRSSVLLSV